ncbi:unnamed protein product [Prorocentrum cordatum]|uniref:Cilia- and flagella-associated protein 157 n=1 Tax=Prorocentrum cordatum TaxID=2364126 RepID=A0ABN9U1J4_9DINO|nr:unnamed protein product [Polarella glacialis]
MSAAAGWQDGHKSNGASHEAASLAHEHLLLLTDRMAVEVEEQRRITSQMMDEKLRAITEEVQERLRRMNDEMQAQMEMRLESQREATQDLLSKSGESTQLLVQSHRMGIEDRLMAQQKCFEERLATLTLSSSSQPEQELELLTPRTQQDEEEERPESMTEEAAQRLEAFQLLEWRVGELLRRERAALRNATSSLVLALEQDRVDREALESRLEQTAEACQKAAYDARSAMDLGLADHASMVRALREELSQRGVTGLPQQRAWLPAGGGRVGRGAGGEDGRARSDADGLHTSARQVSHVAMLGGVGAEIAHPTLRRPRRASWSDRSAAARAPAPRGASAGRCSGLRHLRVGLRDATKKRCGTKAPGAQAVSEAVSETVSETVSEAVSEPPLSSIATVLRVLPPDLCGASRGTSVGARSAMTAAAPPPHHSEESALLFVPRRLDLKVRSRDRVGAAAPMAWDMPGEHGSGLPDDLHALDVPAASRACLRDETDSDAYSTVEACSQDAAAFSTDSESKDAEPNSQDGCAYKGPNQSVGVLMGIFLVPCTQEPGLVAHRRRRRGAWKASPAPPR